MKYINGFAANFARYGIVYQMVIQTDTLDEALRKFSMVGMYIADTSQVRPVVMLPGHIESEFDTDTGEKR